MAASSFTKVCADAAASRNTAGIVFHTIGLGGGHDPVLLRRLAEENGGIYVGR